MDLIEDVLTQLEALDLMDDNKQLIIQLMQDRLDCCLRVYCLTNLGKRTSKLISQCKLRTTYNKQKHYVDYGAWLICHQSFWDSTKDFD